MDTMECGLPMGQNKVIVVCPFGGCNQNDSIVLNKQSVERGLGCSLSYHTTRFDIHHPYRLFLGHPDIPGGLGVVLPGHTVHPGRPLLAAHIPVGTSGESTHEAEQDPLLRCAKADDSGIVHKVVIMPQIANLGHGSNHIRKRGLCLGLQWVLQPALMESGATGTCATQSQFHGSHHHSYHYGVSPRTTHRG